MNWLSFTWNWFWFVFSPRLWDGIRIAADAEIPPILDIIIVILVFFVVAIVWFLMLFVFVIIWIALAPGTTIIWIIAFFLDLIFNFGWTINYIKILHINLII